MNPDATPEHHSMPKSIPLFRHLPVRRPFSFEAFDPVRVRGVEDLPPHLVMGPLDPSSFVKTAAGWSATFHGPEPDSHLRMSFAADRASFRLEQAWRGIDGGLCVAPANLPLGRIVGQMLLRRFPRAWDLAAKDLLQQAFQLTYIEQPEHIPSICGIPDGPFRTLALPVAIHSLATVRSWIEEGVARSPFPFPCAAEARFVVQAVNFVEQEAPAWSRSAQVLFERSRAETGTEAFEMPFREVAQDGSAAWTLRRPVCLVMLTVPFAGLMSLLARLQAHPGPIRDRTAAPVRIEWSPMVIPAGFEQHAGEIQLWDAGRTTRTCWQFSATGFGGTERGGGSSS